MTRSTQAKLLILAVFVVGMFAGAIATDLYLTNVLGDTVDAPERASVRGRPSLREFLALNEAQEAQLDAILRKTGEAYRELRAETNPMYRALTEQSRDEIRAILNDRQRARYEEWIEAERERRRQERGNNR